MQASKEFEIHETCANSLLINSILFRMLDSFHTLLHHQLHIRGNNIPILRSFRAST